MSLQSSWKIIRTTVSDFMNDRALTLGAALAYYAIFSIGPLLVIAVGVAGLVFSDDGARQQLTEKLRASLGEKPAGMLVSMMSAQSRKGSLVATILGVAALLLGASGIFGQLKSALNIIWRVVPKPGRGIVGLIADRLVSFLMVFAIGLILIASMMLTTLISGFYQTISRYIPLPHVVLQLLNLGISGLLLALLFAAMFKALPDVKVPWRDVWIGASFTALLFLAGEFLISLYLGRRGMASSYGAAGSVVLILMWIYYSSLILLAGAEFTRVYTHQRGDRIETGKFAMLAPDQGRA
jgi:membrane protein